VVQERASIVPPNDRRDVGAASLSTPFTCAGMEFANVWSDDLQVSAKSTAPQYPVPPLRPQNGDRGAKGRAALLTRDGLARAIADRCEELSLAQARYLVDDVLDQIVNASGRGQTLILRDVGTFSICVRGRRWRFQLRAKAVLKTHARTASKLKRAASWKAQLQMATDRRIVPPSEIDLELRGRIQAVRCWRAGCV